jgi:predicted dehydrogenase
MTEPLRIGILGAARISDMSIIEPARQLGHRLVAVAARNRQRAEQYAAEKDIERVHDSYGELINDPEVEVVYNPLPNSLHAPWNVAAIRAGKHVFSEKPFASNADEASYVHALAASTSQVVFEAFHYRYHPIFQRLLEISNDGTIGELTRFHVTMSMPAPAPDDLRWSWSLSGGCLMDLGCYCVHVIRTLAASRDSTVSLAGAAAGQRADLPQMDEWCNATFQLSDGVVATAAANMAGKWNFSIAATGTTGNAHVPNFIHVHEDDRLIIRTEGHGERIERLGRRSTYAYQMDALVGAIRQGRLFPTTTTDAVENMMLVDECYRASGFEPRQAMTIKRG